MKKTYKYLYVSILFILSFQICISQEDNNVQLIHNGGFEHVVNGADRNRTFDKLVHWKNPGKDSTPDYFWLDTDKFPTKSHNETNFGNVRIKRYDSEYLDKKIKNQGVVGIMVYNGQNISKGNYREYISIKLKEPLKIGREYTLKFSLTNGDFSAETEKNYGKYCITRMGALFSHEMPVQEKSEKIDATPQHTIDECFYYHDWRIFEFKFTAEEAFKYLTIGNFNDDYDAYFNNDTEYEIIDTKKGSENHCYYFIDDVSLSMHPIAKYVTPVPIEQCGEKLKLSNLLFEINSHSFVEDKKEKALKELEIVFSYLINNPNYMVEIAGHSDYIPQKVARDSMINLSKGRAEVIKSYLTEKGIFKERIIAQGYGPDRPLSKKKNIKNRRVEISILCEKYEQPISEKPQLKTVNQISNHPKDLERFNFEKEAVGCSDIVDIKDPYNSLRIEKGTKVRFYFLHQLWESPDLKVEKGIVPLYEEFEIVKVKRKITHKICDGDKKVMNDWYKIKKTSQDSDPVIGWIFGLNYINLANCLWE